MPCNAEPVMYWAKRGAAGKVVTPSGEVVSCEFEGDPQTASGIGYVSHFSSCPQAKKFRKKIVQREVSLVTLQELSRYSKLKERKARDEQILESLKAAAVPGAQIITGMPHGTGVQDKVGDLAAEIVDMQNEIDDLKIQIAKEEQHAVAYIEAVEDEQMRTIMRLRFLRCLEWRDAAHIIGGGNTEEGVKTACYRYLKPKKVKRHVP